MAFIERRILICATSKSLRKSPSYSFICPARSLRGPDLLMRAVERGAPLARGCHPRSATHPGRAGTPSSHRGLIALPGFEGTLGRGARGVSRAVDAHRADPPNARSGSV